MECTKEYKNPTAEPTLSAAVAFLQEREEYEESEAMKHGRYPLYAAAVIWDAIQRYDGEEDLQIVDLMNITGLCDVVVASAVTALIRLDFIRTVRDCTYDHVQKSGRGLK